MIAVGYSDNKNLGMTLVELLVVVAILSILLTIAIPSYKSYAAKEKVTEAYLALEEYKIRTIKIAALYGAPSAAWPDYILYPDGDISGGGALGNNDKLLTKPLNYVNQISAYLVGTSVLLGARLITSGDITATNNYVYIAYMPNLVSGVNMGYQWVCGTSGTKTNNVASSLLPSNCSAALP